MAATKDEISSWFDRGVAQKATHMIVVCDTFDYEDYPCFASSDADAIEQHSYYDGKNMQRVMEVYDLRAGKAEQMSERRAMRLPTGGTMMDPHIDGVVPIPMSQDEQDFLSGNLRRIHAAYDDDGFDLSALPKKAADEINRLRELADSEGTRAVEYLRRARKSEADVARIILEEEGAKEAFAHVVQQKHDAEAECNRLHGLLDSAYADIRRMSQWHNAADKTEEHN